MIRASVRAGALIQRLRLGAARLATDRKHARRSRPQRTDWHRAAALWPDLFGEPRDGK